jgi:anti-sigma B factor antagonist
LVDSDLNGHSRLRDMPANEGRLEATRDALGEVELVAVRGDIDLGSAAQLGDELSHAVWQAKGPVVVDLTGVQFMDSTGLHLLLNTLRRLKRQRRELALACDAPAVLRVFETTGLLETFTIEPTREAALAAV